MNSIINNCTSVSKFCIYLLQTPEDLWANHSKFVSPKPHMGNSPEWKAIMKVPICWLNLATALSLCTWFVVFVIDGASTKDLGFGNRSEIVDKSWGWRTSSLSSHWDVVILAGRHHILIILSCSVLYKVWNVLVGYYCNLMVVATSKFYEMHMVNMALMNFCVRCLSWVCESCDFFFKSFSRILNTL